MKHKLIRLTALIMAVIMCIPTNITALAAETTATEAQQTAYMAAISPAEYGTIVFTGGDGNSRKFNKNDKVDVTLRPDKGYQVSQFKVTNTDTGKVLAQKNTTDNRFTFYMPEKNVTISASFSEEGAGNGSENASGESGTSEEDGSDGEDSEPRPEEEELPVESSVDAGTDAPENKTDNVVNMKFENGVTAHLYNRNAATLQNTTGISALEMFEHLSSHINDNKYLGTSYEDMSNIGFIRTAIQNAGGTAPEGDSILQYAKENALEYKTYEGTDLTKILDAVLVDAYEQTADIIVLRNAEGVELAGFYVGDAFMDYGDNHYDVNEAYWMKDVEYEEVYKDPNYGRNLNRWWVSTPYITENAGVQTTAGNISALMEIPESSSYQCTVIPFTKGFDYDEQGNPEPVDLGNGYELSFEDDGLPVSDTCTDIVYAAGSGHVDVYNAAGEKVGTATDGKPLEITTDFNNGLNYETYTLKAYADDGHFVQAAYDDGFMEDGNIHKTAYEVEWVFASAPGNADHVIAFSDGDDPEQFTANARDEGELPPDESLQEEEQGETVSEAEDKEHPVIAMAKTAMEKIKSVFGMTISAAGEVNVDEKDTAKNERLYDNSDPIIYPWVGKKKYGKVTKGIYANYNTSGATPKLTISGKHAGYDQAGCTKLLTGVAQFTGFGSTTSFDGGYIDIESVFTDGDYPEISKVTPCSHGMKEQSGAKVGGDDTIFPSKSSLKKLRIPIKWCTDANERSTNPHGSHGIYKIYWMSGKTDSVINKKTRFFLIWYPNGKCSSCNQEQVFCTTFTIRPTPIKTKDCALILRNKIMTNAAYFAGNTNYSVEGAVYGIYTDAACTTPAKDDDGEPIEIEIEATTNNTIGEGYADGLKADTPYYIREIPTPQTSASGVNWNPTVIGPITLAAANDTSNPYVYDLSSNAALYEPPTTYPGFNISKYANATAQDPVQATYALEFNMDGTAWTKVADITVTGGNPPAWTPYPMSNGQPFDHTQMQKGDYRLYETGQTGPINGRGQFLVTDLRTSVSTPYGIPTAAAPFYFSVDELPDQTDPNLIQAGIFINGQPLPMGVSFTAYNSYNYYGFHFTKTDLYYGSTPEGNAPNLQATYQLFAGVGEGGTYCTVNPDPNTQNNLTGTSYENGQFIMEFTTDASGNYTSAPYLLSPGTYTFKEKGAPTGYRLKVAAAGSTISSAAAEGTRVEAGMSNEPKYGCLGIRKSCAPKICYVTL